MVHHEVDIEIVGNLCVDLAEKRDEFFCAVT